MDEKLTFEKANERLDEVLNKMEIEGLTLEETLEYYEEAFRLFEFCFKQLNDSKKRIININERLEAMTNEGELFEE